MINLIRKYVNKIILNLRYYYYKFFFKWGYYGKNIIWGKGIVLKGNTKNIYLYNNVEICNYTEIVVLENGKLILEDNVSIGNLNIIRCLETVKIGKDTMTGPYVLIHTSNHNFNNIDISIRNQGYNTKKIFLGENCWIAAHVVILGGTSIGKQVIIGANSLVNSKILDYSLAIGTPVKVIKKINEKK